MRARICEPEPDHESPSPVSQVPSSYFEWPMAAFAAVLALNLLNLALRQNTSRFRSNLLLLVGAWMEGWPIAAQVQQRTS